MTNTHTPEVTNPSSSSVIEHRPLKLKERIENNLVVFFLATLLSGFLSGIGTYQGLLKLIDYEAVPIRSQQALKDELASVKVTAERLEKTLAEQKNAVATQRWLRIKGVQGLFDTNARVIAYVNGRAFSYPSRTIWSRLRPGLPAEDFALPNSPNGYDVSFQLLALDSSGNFQQFGSQQVLEIKQQTFDGTYEVFAFSVGSAGSTKCLPGNIPGSPACGMVNAPAPRIVQVQFEIR